MLWEVDYEEFSDKFGYNFTVDGIDKDTIT